MTAYALTVAATGATSQAFTFDRAVTGNTISNMMWQAKKYSFTATSAATTLSFASGVASGPFGPALDNVVVTEKAAKASDGGPGCSLQERRLEDDGRQGWASLQEPGRLRQPLRQQGQEPGGHQAVGHAGRRITKPVLVTNGAGFPLFPGLQKAALGRPARRVDRRIVEVSPPARRSGDRSGGGRS